ncbi:MAG: NAD(P)-dependent oxidoreductase [Pseudomonadota bacterium]
MTGSALVGHTGFVGSNLLAQHPFQHLYNSRNIAGIAGQSFELLVFCGAQSKKWWANLNPDEDLRKIRAALDPLTEVSAAKSVLISTIDVIPPLDGDIDESVNCRAMRSHPYGENRLHIEEFFRARFPNTLIVRLPGLFGPGLAKNVIFDLMNDNLLDKINPASTFQYYDLARLWADIETALAAGLKLVHLFAEPLSTVAIAEKFFPGKAIGADAAPVAHYDFRTCHDRLFGGGGGYIEDRAAVLDRLGAFIRAEMAK